jgi:hypothetical protein
MKNKLDLSICLKTNLKIFELKSNLIGENLHLNKILIEFENELTKMTMIYMHLLIISQNIR